METLPVSSLEGLPTELRYEIYSYFLSHKHTLVYHEGDAGCINLPGLSFTYAFDTAIFRVSRRLGLDALDYFRRENTWLPIEAEKAQEDQPNIPCESAVSTLGWMLPIIRLTKKHTKYPRKTFKITYARRYKEPDTLIEVSNFKAFLMYKNIWTARHSLTEDILNPRFRFKGKFIDHPDFPGLGQSIAESLESLLSPQSDLSVETVWGVLEKGTVVDLSPETLKVYSGQQIFYAVRDLCETAFRHAENGHGLAGMIELNLVRLVFFMMEQIVKIRERNNIACPQWQPFCEASAIVSCHLTRLLLDLAPTHIAVRATNEPCNLWSMKLGNLSALINLNLPWWDYLALMLASR